MRGSNLQSSEANDLDIQKVRDSVLTFLQRYPNDVDALNEAMLPFAYITILRSPHLSTSRSIGSADNESRPLSHQARTASKAATGGEGVTDGGKATGSLGEEVEVIRAGRIVPESHPESISVREQAVHNPHVAPASGVEDRGNTVRKDNTLPQHAGMVTRLDTPRTVEVGGSATQAIGIQKLQTARRDTRAGVEDKRRRGRVEPKSGAKRRKLSLRHDVLDQRISPGRPRDAEHSLPDPASPEAQQADSRFSPAPGILAKEALPMGELDPAVLSWMKNPEVILVLQDKALARYRQPKHELLSYLNLIVSIGTVEVLRSFAMGVILLMRNHHFSFEVPAAPNHLLNVEDADTMQCFWRAAYRVRVNASFVSFSVILHRRSLATLRNCYFKAMKAIKATMKRKGNPGYTKAAIARGILLDTVFPGSDKAELKKMSDRLKNDVTRARNYCRLIEYYGNSGILALLPLTLTDTRMRDFTDAEFDLFLALIGRLRPDLECERTTLTAVAAGEYSRMRVLGRIIDMTQAGLRPHESDFDFLQNETNIIFRQAKSILSGSESIPSGDNMGSVMSRAADQISPADIERGDQNRPVVGPEAVSHNPRQEEDFDTCGPSEIQLSSGRIHEESV